MENIKIGVGVITVGKRELHDYLITDPSASFHVNLDKDRKGVAHARNELMKKFYDEGFTHWFIFDDDCYPVYPGWETYFVNQAIKGDWDFFGMPEYFKDEVDSVYNEVVIWKQGLCQFGMYTRAVIEKTGYFKAFSHGYGYEDTEWMERLPTTGLNKGIKGVPCPIRVMAYIHPDDVFGNNPTPYANLTKEEKEQGIGINWQEYLNALEDIKNGKNFISYEEAQGNAK